jgi:exodeoxyribonuclease VII large subunit
MENAANRITNLNEQLLHKTASSIRNRKDNLLAFQHRLDKQNPNEPLEKGFARVWQEGKWIRNSKDLHQKESFDIEWKDERIKV